MLVILLTAAVLRVIPLAADVRFHPDEALFTAFARDAVAHGDWMLHGDLDKTPLSIYTNAASLTLFAATYDRGVPDFEPRAGEFAARLPGVFASWLQVVVVYALAKRLYRDWAVTQWSALFMALSPLAIAYGASAYTDGLMLLFSTVSLWLCAANRPLAAGIALALGFASKQQAFYFMPLCAALLILSAGGDHRVWRRVLLFAAPIGGMFALLLGWDALRRPSPPLFALAAVRNNPGRLIRSTELTIRLNTWAGWAQFMIGAPTALLVGFIPVSIGWRAFQEPRRHTTVIDLALLIFLLGYAFVHWLIAFNSYDRYLLPLLPVLAILAARAGSWLWQALSRRITRPELIVAAGAVVLSLLSGARDAAVGSTIYNAERRDVCDMIGLATYLNALPTATIVYDHWLGWELSYYLGAWSDKRRVYYPTPNSLAQAAAMLDEREPRYFPVPSNRLMEVWLAPLETEGFRVERVYMVGSCVVYRLTPP